MSDAMQVAQQRRAGYQKAIAQKETEIAELKEHLEDLDNFLEFGESLMGNDPAAAATAGTTTPAARTVVSRPAVSRPITQENAEDKKDEAKADDDEWGSDDGPKESIARVLASRAG
jgi:glutathione S-transferase